MSVFTRALAHGARAKTTGVRPPARGPRSRKKDREEDTDQDQKGYGCVDVGVEISEHGEHHGLRWPETWQQRIRLMLFER